MPRLTPVVLAALALAVLVVSVAAPTVAAKEETVEVTVDCGSVGEGPGAVTVNPWRLWLKQGDQTTWTLTAESTSKTIIVEPKRDQKWPYVERQHVGAEGKAEARGMTGTPIGDYTYNITFYCHGEAFVIDPRVRVGP